MSLPPIDNSLIPADIRSAGRARTDEYKAALGFERLLVQQLTKSMADTAQGDDEGGDAASKTYRSMLPEHLADAITQSGGLGLARSLMTPEAKR